MSAVAAIAEGLVELAKVILPSLIEKHGGDYKAALADLGDEYESRRTEKMPDVSGEVAANQANVDALLEERRKREGG